jgi:hypothetical protein
MDDPEIIAAISTLGWLELIRRIGGFMVIAGVAIEVGGDWLATPLHKKVDDARELQIANMAKDTATAQENAARLETLLNDEIKKNAWRRLTKEQYDGIAAAVRAIGSPKVTFGFDGSDSEASVYASDLMRALAAGGSDPNPQPSNLLIGQMPVFGLLLQAAPGFGSAAFEKALSDFDVQFERSQSLTSFSAPTFDLPPWQSPYSPKIVLYVGHRAQPF